MRRPLTLTWILILILFINPVFAERKLWFEEEPYKDRGLYKRKPLEIEEKETSKFTGYALVVSSMWFGYIGYNFLSGATKKSKLAYVGTTTVFIISISSLISGIKILSEVKNEKTPFHAGN